MKCGGRFTRMVSATEAGLRRISLPGLVLAVLSGCSDGAQGQSAADATGGFATFGAGGTPLGGGAPGSGGVIVGAGGAIVGAGGVIVGTGGVINIGGIGGVIGNGGAGGFTGTSGAGGVIGSGGVGGLTGTGGAGTGGADTGGSSGTGGTSSCPFPTSFHWSSTGPLAQPKSPPGHDFVSLKDFTVVHWNNQFVVYATVFDTSNSSWNGVNFNFSDWSQADAAPQTYMGSTPAGGTVAPDLFYFTPKNIWVLTYQWGFKYATTTDPTKPSTWSSPKTLMTGDPTGGTGTGPIDQTVICDATNCYIFFAGDNGHIYRGSMPIGNFPGTFNNATSIMSDTQSNLFEAVQVYAVKGTGQYLMIVEAMGGGGRYFRAFSANSLDGNFTAIPGASSEATPFAGKNNVTFSGTAWTNDISHGDMVRDDPSETETIDPCNMQFLYQGRDPNVNVGYGELPYRPGLLTKAN